MSESTRTGKPRARANGVARRYLRAAAAFMAGHRRLDAESKAGRVANQAAADAITGPTDHAFFRASDAVGAAMGPVSEGLRGRYPEDLLCRSAWSREHDILLVEHVDSGEILAVRLSDVVDLDRDPAEAN
ncbi:MAG TPA: hypothetical protein VG406_04370 [Isosphaeraceae bacterium]|jgi:hypothetical protein|nr:hypothetical protein [Isosphaeraceae bacterium]